MYDVSLSTLVKKSDLKDETEISCVLGVPGTDYIKQKDVTYNGMKELFKFEIFLELSSTVFSFCVKMNLLSDF